VVTPSSASPQLSNVTYYGIEATHSKMCKFATATAPGYRTIATAIRDWIGDAGLTISRRWASEEEARARRAFDEISERQSPFVSN
jgi:hypothetical protein